MFEHGLKWEGFVFTVNRRNRYRHPGAENLLLCMEKVGAANVHFTGRANVRITPEGIPALNSREVRENYRRFIEPRLDSVHSELGREWGNLIEARAAGQTISEEQAKKVARKRASYDALLEVRKKMFPENGKIDPPPPLPPDPWGPDKQPPTGDLPDWITKRTPDGPTYPRIPVGGPQIPWKPSPNGASVGPFAQRMKRLERAVPVRPVPPGSTIRLQNRSRFAPAMRIRPVFGGISIGNKVHSDLTVLKASFEVRDGQPAIVLEVATKEGRDTCRFEEMSMTELWVAYYFVAPTTRMQKEYGVRPGEASLLGITAGQRDGWEFAIHPAIANTILARDGMRLDMLIALDPKELPKLPKFLTYQWYDEESVITAQEGILHVEGKTKPRNILLRVRLWGETQPPWLKLRTLEEEIDRREDERARQAGLTDTAFFQLTRIESKALRAIQAELDRGNPVWLKPGEDKFVALKRELLRRYAEAAKAAGLADSAPYKLDILRADIILTLHGERRAGQPKWMKAGEDMLVAEGREFSRRFAEKAKEAGLTDSSVYRVEQLRVDIILKLSEDARSGRANWDETGQDEVVAASREFSHRYADKAKEAGLIHSAEYRLVQLAEDVKREVRSELEGEIANPHRNYATSVWKVSEAMRRIDRFARTVAVLNWLADQDKLPELPAEVKPVLMNVPARFRYEDVLPNRSEPKVPHGN